MRLWHKDIIPYLPKGQLVAQWRELNSIFKKQDNHILINYIYDYHKDYLLDYTNMILQEFDNRGYKINKMNNYNNYFEELIGKTVSREFLAYEEHNNRYLMQCFMNLQEKYYAKQKDFDDVTYQKLLEFIKERGLTVQYE